MTKELQTVERLDVVFDTYKKDSLKATTRQKRGKGIRQKVEEQSLAPTNWHSFLRIDKTRLNFSSSSQSGSWRLKSTRW